MATSSVGFSLSKDIVSTTEVVTTLTLTAENIREMFTDAGVNLTGTDIGLVYWTNGGRKVLTTDMPDTGTVFTFAVKSVSIVTS